MKKRSADPTANTYWSDYFADVGDYGRDLVRQIPRRVASALSKAGTRTGYRIRHVGHVIETDGSLRVEGTIAWPAEKRALLFSAQFLPTGEVTTIDTLPL